MTATGILPSYQRFVNGVPVPSFSRKSFRPREKYVIVVVFLTFVLGCFATFFFLPEMRATKATADSVYRVYDSIKRAGPELLIPPPPHLENDKDSRLIRHEKDSKFDPHVSDDRAKLKSKIDQDEQLKVLERPDMGLSVRKSSSTTSSKYSGRYPDSGAVDEPVVPDNNNLIELQPQQMGANVITVPAAAAGRFPKIVGGEDQDPEVREKRDKVKEVSETVR